MAPARLLTLPQWQYQLSTSGGEWNTYEIIAKGTELTVKLNGTVTVSSNDSKFTSGPFALPFGPRVKGVRVAPSSGANCKSNRCSHSGWEVGVCSEEYSLSISSQRPVEISAYQLVA
jgi:hypothetical protein